MANCTAIARSGDRCRGIALEGSDYCHAHHPDRAEERRRYATRGGKKAGRGRPLIDVADAKRRLSELADDVLSGAVDRSVAGTASQILNVYLRDVDLGLKVREQEELEARLSELEEQLEAGKGGYRGA